MNLGKTIAAAIFVACTALPVLGQQMPDPDGDARSTNAKLMSDLWRKLLERERELDAKQQSLLANPPEGSVAAVAAALERMRETEQQRRTELDELHGRLRRILEERVRPLLAEWTEPGTPPGYPVAEEKPPVRETPSGPPPSRSDAQGTSAAVAASVRCGEPGIAALPLPDRPGLYRRVLAVPGARLRRQPDAAAGGEPLPLFAILYVSAEKDGWLCVGPKLDDAGQGWVPVDETRPWKHMLVARFVEKGARRQVLFFDDAEGLRALLEDLDREERARELYRALANGERPEGVVAVEPAAAIDYATAPYLLPIVEARDAETYDGDLVRIVKVAAAARSATAPGSRQASATTATAQGSSGGQPPRIGIAFVVDTTSSMGPYINEIRRFLARFQAMARKSEYGGRIAFAIVGYRDNTSPDPRIGYVSRVFLDFESAVSDRVLDQALAVEAARVSTRNWREDAVAGLLTALEELSWEKADARIVVLVTDASARDAGDPLATTPHGIESIRALAQQRGVAIVVIHLRTPEAERAGDVDRAERQYRKLATTGDRNVRKYIGLEGNTVEAFRVQLERAAEELLAALGRGRLQGTARAEGPGRPVTPKRGSLSDFLLHEIFARSWLEIVGREQGADLPDFVEGWAADRDILRPDYEALAVSVLLTRTELDDLAVRLDRIVDAVRAGGSAGEFWKNVWELAGEKVTDPDAVRRIGQLLPAYLEDLPYRSKILSISRERWDAMGQTEKLGLVNEIAEKISIYRAAIEDQTGWIRTDSDDRGADLYPLELRYLP